MSLLSLMLSKNFASFKTRHALSIQDIPAFWCTYTVADPAMGGPGGRPSIDQNLGLVMAARLDKGANFHLNP